MATRKPPKSSLPPKSKPAVSRQEQVDALEEGRTQKRKKKPTLDGANTPVLDSKDFSLGTQVPLDTSIGEPTLRGDPNAPMLKPGDFPMGIPPVAPPAVAPPMMPGVGGGPPGLIPLRQILEQMGNPGGTGGSGGGMPPAGPPAAGMPPGPQVAGGPDIGAMLQQAEAGLDPRSRYMGTPADAPNTAPPGVPPGPLPPPRVIQPPPGPGGVAPGSLMDTMRKLLQRGGGPPV